MTWSSESSGSNRPSALAEQFALGYIKAKLCRQQTDISHIRDTTTAILTLVSSRQDGMDTLSDLKKAWEMGEALTGLGRFLLRHWPKIPAVLMGIKEFLWPVLSKWLGLG